MPHYTLEPGRHIHRDGQPFIYIGRAIVLSLDEQPFYVSPFDVDDAARRIVRLLNKEETP